MKINWRYTLGEILIVIIGITIAFSLNNWSERSKEKAQREQYLINLKNDIEADKAALEKNYAEIETKMIAAQKVLPVLGSNDTAAKMGAIQDIFAVVVISNFSAKDITYNTLINSGDLKLIKDFELKTAIESHYSEYELMMKAYERQENIQKEYLGPYFIEHIDYDAFRRGEFGFEEERLLKNIIRSMEGSFRIKKTAIEKGIASCDALISNLSEHLD